MFFRSLLLALFSHCAKHHLPQGSASWSSSSLMPELRCNIATSSGLAGPEKGNCANPLFHTMRGNSNELSSSEHFSWHKLPFHAPLGNVSMTFFFL